MPGEEFTYDRINEKGSIISEDQKFYSCCPMPTDTKSIAFTCVSREALGKREEGNGWKFQVAIDDTNPFNMAAGWNIVKDILIKHEISVSKVIRDSTHLSGHSRGKQITIYAGYNPDTDWQEVISEINRSLAEANIIPDKLPSGCRHVPGSHYISYRNDFSPRKSDPYLSAEKAAKKHSLETQYNPYKYPDPFQEIAVSLPKTLKQPSPKKTRSVAPAWAQVFEEERKTKKPPSKRTPLQEIFKDQTPRPK